MFGIFIDLLERLKSVGLRGILLFAKAKSSKNFCKDFILDSSDKRGSIFDEKSGLRSHERGNKTNRLLTKRVASLPDLSQKDNRAF